MRILHVSEAFGGGVFTSLTLLASGLARRGHEVHLAFARRPETPVDVAAFVHPDVRLHVLELVRPIRPLADLAGTVRLMRLLRRLEPDIVHLHSSKAGILGRVAARVVGRSTHTFYSPRGLAFLQEDHAPRTRRLFELLEWGAARLGGTVVACSPSEEALVRERIRPRALALVENAVDVGSVVPRADRADGLTRVGIIGRITHARNPALFVELAQRNTSAGTRFVWVGGGDADSARMLERAGVEVTGWKSRPEALAELSRLDIYLHPSRWEGMPIALIEAQVAGLPAVATDVVGNRDVVRDGETGFVRRGAPQLSDALAMLVSDAALRARMGKRAREIAMKRFDLERMLDDYERLYADVTRPARNRAASL